MFTVYPTKMKAMKNMYKEFDTQKEAQEYIDSRKNPSNYTMITPSVKITPSTKRAKDWKKEVNFMDAIEVTRTNVKEFYHKKGFIKVVDENGKTLHIGRTSNMGKVFSNYVNCARYNQSYDFNLDGTDKLLFKEGEY